MHGAVAVQKRLIYGYDNSYILDSCRLYPDTFASLVILDAEDPATPGLLRMWTANNQLAGVRLFGYRQPDGSTPWLNSPEALRTWQAAQELGLVVDLEVICQNGGAVVIPMLLDLVERFPDVPVVLDHLLEPRVADQDFGFAAGYERLAAHPRIFYKFTSINLDILRESGVDAAAFLRRAVDLFGARQLMWGSDIGTSSGTYKDMVARAVAATSHLDDGERATLLNETGRRVFVRGGAVADPTRQGRSTR
ncbi:Predicted metal-dependent hydrolase, TIM-barrel fold [Pseudacidovorax sp. RU35E]|nr:Predicted metal-dependent hydrolase, TIM-barrel fold [Pseudacidovorax sp. RU35E]